jgi:hypothetical protein
VVHNNLKLRIQVLEKKNKECEKCKAYAKKMLYNHRAAIDYDTELNNQSEKLSEFIEYKKGRVLSPKGGSVVGLQLQGVNENDLDDDEFIQIKPNHVEKLSLALTHSLKDPLLGQIRKSSTKSERSDPEESVSMKDELDNISEPYHGKLRRELELTISDLRKLRSEYEEISIQNLTYKKTISEFQEKTSNMGAKMLKLEKLK